MSSGSNEETLRVFLESLLTKSFISLARAKNLERTIISLTQPIEEKELKSRLLRLIPGLDKASGEAKKQRIKKILETLEKYQQDISSGKKSWILLSDSVRYLKGVGPRRAEQLGQKGIQTILDLIYYLPYRYEDRRNLKKISQLASGERAVVAGRVVAVEKLSRWRNQIFQAVIDDGSGAMTLKWFNLPGTYLEEKLKKGQMIIASQTVRKYGALLEMAHPEIELLEQGEELDSLSFGRIVPIYSLPEGFSQKWFRPLIKSSLEQIREEPEELIPEEVRKNRNLPLLLDSIKNLHFPESQAELSELNQHRSIWHQRLYYQEFFILELALALSKKGRTEKPAYPVQDKNLLAEKLNSLLEFSLTPAQKRVIEEINNDLAQAKPMHRLLQGDVGSGKTMVALFCALSVIGSGLQVAVMAPSEVLAEQHWLNLHRYLDQLGISCALLTSAVKGEPRRKILENAKSGRLSVLVGTQALIQEQVEFFRLGLAIIDEQHRFGVQERARLKAKGKEQTPHILVMTATPIPRSLAMTAYGDLDLSILDQMPPGRKPPKTILLFSEEVNRAWQEIKLKAKKAEQAYIVYPLVSESSKLELQDATRKYEELSREVFPELKLGLLHGQLCPEEKERMMERFRKGEVQALVATTVIEVGIDVPNATVMVIEHSERFGLSQLHQLRGRVARSEKQPICFLVAHPPLTEFAVQRLETLLKTTDGFQIAEADLSIRGPGEFLGVRQSGLPPFRFADIIRDAKELSLARNDAFQFAESADWKRMEYAELRKELISRYGKFLPLARVG